MLFNGGSWYEADQMYWRILQNQVTLGLQEIVKTKPTTNNREKAETLLGKLKETTTQLWPQEDSMAVFQRVEQVVKVWTPAPKTTVVKTQHKNNTFALLGDDEE